MRKILLYLPLIILVIFLINCENQEINDDQINYGNHETNDDQSVWKKTSIKIYVRFIYGIPQQNSQQGFTSFEEIEFTNSKLSSDQISILKNLH